jgi:acid stress-induced BolA-like protein IbaG/YrbA
MSHNNLTVKLLRIKLIVVIDYKRQQTNVNRKQLINNRIEETMHHIFAVSFLMNGS